MESNYLTREQVLKAFEKIEPLLGENSEEEKLSERIAQLEDKLFLEKLRRKSLEQEVEDTVAGAQKINQELEETHSRQTNWKAMWMHLNEDYEDLKKEYEATHEQYYEDIEGIRTTLEKTEKEVQLYKGDAGALEALGLADILSLEKKVMAALQTMQTLKSAKLEAMVSEEVDHSYLCKVCLERSNNILVRPCQHISLCEDCLPEVSSCPVCHCPIDSFLKIYLTKY